MYENNNINTDTEASTSLTRNYDFRFSAKLQVSVYGAGVPSVRNMSSDAGYFEQHIDDPAKVDSNGNQIPEKKAIIIHSANKEGDEERKNSNSAEREKESNSEEQKNALLSDSPREAAELTSAGNVRVKLSIGNGKHNGRRKDDSELLTGKMISKLQELERAGDHLFVVELKRRLRTHYYWRHSDSDESNPPENLCAVPLKPSDILKCLEEGDDRANEHEDGGDRASDNNNNFPKKKENYDLCFSKSASVGGVAGLKASGQHSGSKPSTANLIARSSEKESDAGAANADVLKTIERHRALAELKLKVRKTCRKLRYAVCPLLTLAGAWAMLFRRDEILAATPPFPGFGWAEGGRELIHQVLPPVPADMLQAFNLGRLCEEVRALGNSSSTTPTNYLQLFVNSSEITES
jgi:hypothetical protein